MRSASIIGLATLGLLAVMPLAGAATGKPAAKEGCVIHVQTAPRTLISANLRACPLKRALNLLETQRVTISRHPAPLGNSLLTHSFEKLPVQEALQRMFAPYNYILYAESGRVHLEIIGLLSNGRNPPTPPIPISSEIAIHPSPIPQALTRPSRRTRLLTDNANPTPLSSEVGVFPPIEEKVETPGEVKVETFDSRITDDQGRKLPPFTPNPVLPSDAHSAKSIPPSPTKHLPPFTPITNKTGPIIDGSTPRSLPAFTPNLNKVGPE